MIKDSDSRQAIMHYNRPIHQYDKNGDFVCTLYSQFFIRNNKLYMTTCMRSMDLLYGYPFDVVFFTLMQQSMRLELLKYYPTLELGSYTHFVGSLHMYERNFDTFIEMNKNEYIPETLPVLTESLVKHPDLNKSESDNEFIQWIIKNK